MSQRKQAEGPHQAQMNLSWMHQRFQMRVIRVIFHHHLKHTDTHPWAQASPASDTKRSFPVMARRAWVMQLQSDKSKIKIQGCAETDSAVAVP